jgi:nitrite reductase/ring-hydroxylating ferredoxin subunit
MRDGGEWVQTADVADIRARPLKTVYPKGVPILLIAKGSDIYAISNRCPHLGCPLSGGTLTGETIICPCHDWSFDIMTGELTISKEIKLPTYETKVENGRLFVKLED